MMAVSSRNSNGETLRQNTVAVIVPIHRWGRDAEACLEAVRALVPPPDEIALGLDGLSIDEIPQSLRQSLEDSAVLHFGHGLSREGPARARNNAAKCCASEILLFLDSDVVAPADLIARVREAFVAEPGMAGLIGSYDDEPMSRGVVSRFRNLLHHHQHQTALPEGNTFWGACGAIRASAYREAGGFPEEYRRASIEDIALGQRCGDLGNRIRRRPDIQVKHLKHWTFWSMIVTDVRDRAIPWSTLALSRGQLDNDLNADWRGRSAFAALSACILLSILAMALPSNVALGLALLSAGVWLWTERTLFAFFARKDLLLFLAAIPLRAVFLLLAGSSFVGVHAFALVSRPKKAVIGRDLVPGSASLSPSHHDR